MDCRLDCLQGWEDYFNTADDFLLACRSENKEKARSLYEQDAAIVNRQNRSGVTGLMTSLLYEKHSTSQWLLQLPELDTNITNAAISKTALHYACDEEDTPLDIVIQLAQLSTLETVNKKTQGGHTALDLAVQNDNTCAALQLTWLGAQCREENVQKLDISLMTWIDAGHHQEAQYWAVAANDLPALKALAGMNNVTLDRAKLSRLARLFKHKEIWSFVDRLESQAWQCVRRFYPALSTLSDTEILQRIHYYVHCLKRTKSIDNED